MAGGSRLMRPRGKAATSYFEFNRPSVATYRSPDAGRFVNEGRKYFVALRPGRRVGDACYARESERPVRLVLFAARRTPPQYRNDVSH